MLPCPWIEMPDGSMMPGPHSTTSLGSRNGQTRSSNYLLKAGNELGLIDTGMQPWGLAELIGQIDKLGGRLNWIILTHFHFDHIGNAAVLAQRYRCPVMAHPLDLPAIEDPLIMADGKWVFPNSPTTLEEVARELGGEKKEEMTREVLKKYFHFPAKINRAIVEGNEVPLGPWRLKILETPGHSPGSLSIYNPASRSLYIGDLDYIMNPSNPWPISNAQDLISSVARVSAMEVEYLGIGHYNGIAPKWAVAEYLDDMRYRIRATEQRIAGCLKRLGRASVAQLAEEVFPIIPRYGYTPLHKSAVQCFLHKLVDEGKARQVSEGEKVWWEWAAY